VPPVLIAWVLAAGAVVEVVAVCVEVVEAVGDPQPLKRGTAIMTNTKKMNIFFTVLLLPPLIYLKTTEDWLMDC
jgi:hypothetical protein